VEQIAAILLAAGRSRRMGAFKPLLPFGDTTVIKFCVRQLHDAGLKKIVVVAGHRADEVRSHLHDFDITFATNPDPNSAMGVSIARGIEQVSPPTQAVVIALADHPGVDSSTISLIAGEWQSGAKLVQPRYKDRGGHPVLIDLSYRDELINLNPVEGLRAFFDAHRNKVRRLSVASPYVARDMDTWEDYVRLHEDIFGRPPDVDKSRFS